MIINFSDYSANQRYHLMTQTIIPRPIAWALTLSDDELAKKDNECKFNLAPFSYFTAVSSKPAILMISVGKKTTGEAKDTLVNILNHKKIVIHIASEQQSELVTQTAATLAHGESELDLINLNESVDNSLLSTVPFEGFSLPRLEQCDIAYGCELYEIKEIGDIPQTLIFVEVKQVYINDKVTELDTRNRVKVHADMINPLARLGASEYAGITKPFTKKRPE
ncbi:flavin reductase family protein [Colwellia sp. UCD-KL20]|uniref:flavin reductase family protein n=1 Tax=Colwellia sp. UCD-KL20 TaxID=1917165 RepID=UPI000970D4A6|nr:flavin reductase family protein [Colwellia sp. UCD-KL20]